MMLSAPIAIAAATPTAFTLAGPRESIRVGVVFYTTADALPGEEVAAGTGTRDLAVARTVAPGLTLPIVGAVTSATPARALAIIELGHRVQGCVITASGGANPGTATHYRIVID